MNATAIVSRCHWCGTKFTPEVEGQNYCSRECELGRENLDRMMAAYRGNATMSFDPSSTPSLRVSGADAEAALDRFVVGQVGFTGNQNMTTDWRDRLLGAGVAALVTLTLGAFLVVCWVYAA